MTAGDRQDLKDLFQMAIAAHRGGQPDEAERLYGEVLEATPTHADTLNNLAILAKNKGDRTKAEQLFRVAYDANPGHRVVALGLAALLVDARRYAEAEPAFARALAIEADDADVLARHGGVLNALGRTADALAQFEAALRIAPDAFNILLARCNALIALGQTEAAIGAYDRLLAVRPDHAAGWAVRASLKNDLGDYAGSSSDYAQALRLKPDYPVVLNNHSQVLRRLGRLDDALAALDRAMALRPDYSLAMINRGRALADVGRLAEAVVSYKQGLIERPDHADALGLMFSQQLHLCDWTDHDATLALIRDKTARGMKADMPFPFLAHTPDAHLQLKCATAHATDRFAVHRPPLWNGEAYGHDKIRVAYVSSDLRNHAVAHLIAGLFSRHDRGRFEITGIAIGSAVNDEMRKQLIGRFDRFLDAHALNDLAVAQYIRAHEIDIAVDLNGYTTYCKPEIFAHRPAPIQVNYLGYPGTMGAGFMDYILGDPWVTPPEHDGAYREAVVRMPDSYQVNDAERPISPRMMTRAEAGLPDEAFVFCCFNANHKISPDVYDIWARLLDQVPGSVLWLYRSRGTAAEGLARELERRGISSSRLVFAPSVPPSEHLARHRLADLFIDTFVYNAHTTASDALWAGLPVVTLAGTGFASRVAASLLNAAGLPELITHSPEDYEALILDLARTPLKLSRVKEKLAANRLTCALFDTDRFRRHLEQAYETMMARHLAGARPQGFDVARLK